MHPKLTFLNASTFIKSDIYVTENQYTYMLRSINRGLKSLRMKYLEAIKKEKTTPFVYCLIIFVKPT